MNIVSKRCSFTGECTHGNVRLVGGSVANEGRLELCWFGIWGTVNNANFGTQDATVVCRQLNYYPDCMLHHMYYYPFTQLLTHLLTHSLTHSLTCSLLYLLIF